MRPIDKGNCPNKNGFSDYSQALEPLKERLGRFCSYCERIIKSGIHIEHVQCKKSFPRKRCSWDNFLLACSNCNSSKNEKKIYAKDLNKYLWPDKHNTFLAYIYDSSGIISINTTLDKRIQTKAQRLLDLVGLNNKSTVTNERIEDRIYSWGLAEDMKNDLENAPKSNCLLINQIKKDIIKVAVDQFSIWMTVFANYPDIKKDLITKFTGTAKNAFDPNGNPIPRTSQGI